MLDDYKCYAFKDRKSKICEFKTCFLPDLFCVIAIDIYDTMRPFNLNRVNTEKSSTSERQD